MSLRQSLGNTRLLALALLAGMAWIGFTAVQVLGSIEYWAPAAVGQTAGAGVVGLLVLTIVFVLSLSLFGSLGESDPAPQTWPPENDEA